VAPHARTTTLSIMRRRRRPALALLVAFVFGATTVAPAPMLAESTAPGVGGAAIVHGSTAGELPCHAASHGGHSRHRSGSHGAGCAGTCCACSATPIALRGDRPDVAATSRPRYQPVQTPDALRQVGIRSAPDVVLPYPSGPPSLLG